jgi:spore maturation protein CgeB
MKIVIFGLSISSSWGNGHATLWRGLCRSLAARGHVITFFERDVPYYAANRDLTNPPGVELVFYPDWEQARQCAMTQLSDADVAIVTSYCPDGIAASEAVFSCSRPVSVFYDLDSPITLDRLAQGHPIPYIGPRGLADFDLVLTYTGGAALEELKLRLGAKRAVPLYGSVDPTIHFPVEPTGRYSADLSYLGTYSDDRQQAVQRLLVDPARRLPNRRFLIGGPLYPRTFPWGKNIFYNSHVPPGDHPDFYCSSRITLNVTRAPMARMGYCPSGRLFEAAACGVPILSDNWEGLELFFQPGAEILIGETADDVVDALQISREQLRDIAHSARQRCLEQHTSDIRAAELERIVETAVSKAAVA